MRVESLKLFVLLACLFAVAGSLHAQTYRPTPESEPDAAAVAAKQAAIKARREAEEKALGLVPPSHALARSIVLPGWGQFVIKQRVQGSVFLVGTAGLLTGWWVSRTDFRDAYDNGYLVAVEAYGLNSDEAEAEYAIANERFKISQTFLFSALGVWGFSLLDAYIDANIYNAERRAEQVIEQGRELRKFQVNWDDSVPSLSMNFAF